MKKSFSFKFGGRVKVVVDDERVDFQWPGASKPKDSIRINDIHYIQFKKPCILSGFIRFGLISEKSKVKSHRPVTDKDSIVFNKTELHQAKELKEHMESLIQKNAAREEAASTSDLGA